MLRGGAPLYIVRMECHMKFGFVKDENNSKLKEVFKDNIKIKRIHIDVCTENPFVSSSTPFMLLLRTIENNALVSNDDHRLVLKMDDGFKTYFMNILFSEIKECYYESVDNRSFEFVLNVQNLFYRITVLN